MKELESIIHELSVMLKKTGYKKNRTTWYKEKPSLTVIFSIEKSQYSKNTWYYWFGICLHGIAETSSRSIGNCQVKYRVDNVIDRVAISTESIASLLDRWESLYGDISSLRHCAIQGKLPLLSTLTAKTYLTSLGLSKGTKGTGDDSVS